MKAMFMSRDIDSVNPVAYAVRTRARHSGGQGLTADSFPTVRFVTLGCFDLCTPPQGVVTEFIFPQTSVNLEYPLELAERGIDGVWRMARTDQLLCDVNKLEENVTVDSCLIDVRCVEKHVKETERLLAVLHQDFVCCSKQMKRSSEQLSSSSPQLFIDFRSKRKINQNDSLIEIKSGDTPGHCTMLWLENSRKHWPCGDSDNESNLETDLVKSNTKKEMIVIYPPFKKLVTPPRLVDDSTPNHSRLILGDSKSVRALVLRPLIQN